MKRTGKVNVENLEGGGLMRTPWGQSDWQETLSNGIVGVSTPSHGGYFVPKKLLNRIPVAQQAYAAKWTGSPNWYEEDCAWSIVAVNFPEVFDAKQVAQAQETFGRGVAPELKEAA